jgi:cell division protein ZapA
MNRDGKKVYTFKVADRRYGLWLHREEEELIRKAERQIEWKIDQYRTAYLSDEVSVKDLLAMTTLQLSIEYLKLEEKNDTTPFTAKLQELIDVMETYMKDM